MFERFATYFEKSKILMLEEFGTYFEQIKRAIISFNSVGDILDVILVAFVIYSTIKLIKDTRAFQLVKGVLLLAAVYFVVSLLNMEASKYLLSLLFGNLFIILVIIFSPEIRHALESVGRSSVSNINLFNLKNRDETAIQEFVKESINSVSRACSDLSDKQIGALIVFEKDTMLGEITKTGTPLDASVTPELICNIFFPKAPMHDGAVVIKEGRVVSAGCILPLTGDNNLSSELGTRHRAAIGMSETSDAVVVVVSEETGMISVAEKGTLKRDISAGELRERLTKSFIKENEKDNSKIKKMFRGNKNEPKQ
jgi:diadenylate cyclase